jgi:hypothetical protein
VCLGSTEESDEKSVYARRRVPAKCHKNSYASSDPTPERTEEGGNKMVAGT